MYYWIGYRKAILSFRLLRYAFFSYVLCNDVIACVPVPRFLYCFFFSSPYSVQNHNHKKLHNVPLLHTATMKQIMIEGYTFFSVFYSSPIFYQVRPSNSRPFIHLTIHLRVEGTLDPAAAEHRHTRLV